MGLTVPFPETSQGNTGELGTEKKSGREIERRRKRERELARPRRVYLHLLRFHWLTAAGVKHAWKRFPGGGGDLKKGSRHGGEKELWGNHRVGWILAPLSSSFSSSFSVPCTRGNKYKNHPINPKVRLSGSKNGIEKVGGGRGGGKW